MNGLGHVRVARILVEDHRSSPPVEPDRVVTAAKRALLLLATFREYSPQMFFTRLIHRKGRRPINAVFPRPVPGLLSTTRAERRARGLLHAPVRVGTRGLEHPLGKARLEAAVAERVDGRLGLGGIAF